MYLDIVLRDAEERGPEEARWIDVTNHDFCLDRERKRNTKRLKGGGRHFYSTLYLSMIEICRV